MYWLASASIAAAASALLSVTSPMLMETWVSETSKVGDAGGEGGGGEGGGGSEGGGGR